MSSSTNPEHQHDTHKESGTNSPPLEATGSARPMGMASVAGDVDAGYEPDREQRKAYFGGEAGSEQDKMSGASEAAAGGVERERARESHAQAGKVGQSMAAQMDERT